MIMQMVIHGFMNIERNTCKRCDWTSLDNFRAAMLNYLFLKFVNLKFILFQCISVEKYKEFDNYNIETKKF